jgi:signal transduction histidine kinase
MRLLIFELRPPILDREGLIPALRHRLLSVEDRAGIKTSIQTDMTTRLPSHVEEGLYQIARDALNNIIKHARAKNIEINIQQDASTLSMQIVDDGLGFDIDTAHRDGCLGLNSMQERARLQGWQFHIESNPGDGTRVEVEIKP